jgi:transcriptional regulator with XRE-family HTH domain
VNDISYNYWDAETDAYLSKTLGFFVKHHRLQQNKSQEIVAKEANISRSTLSLLEKGETVTIASFLAVLRVLNLLYVMDTFKITEQISPIALAKLDQKKRKRASNSQDTNTLKSDW